MVSGRTAADIGTLLAFYDSYVIILCSTSAYKVTLVGVTLYLLSCQWVQNTGAAREHVARHLSLHGCDLFRRAVTAVSSNG